MDSRPAKLFQIWSGAVLGAGGKPSTWFPPGWLVEQSLKKIPRARGNSHHSKTTGQAGQDKQKHTQHQTTYTKKTLHRAWFKPRRSKATEQGETQKKTKNEQKSKAKQNTAKAKQEESSKSSPIRSSTKSSHTSHGRRTDTRHAKSRRDATTCTTRESVMCNKRQLRPNKRGPTRGADARWPHHAKLRSDAANKFAPKRINDKNMQF